MALIQKQDNTTADITINDICKQYDGVEWFEDAMNDFVRCTKEDGHSASPRTVRSSGPYDQIDWLVHRCEPPYTLQEIYDYLIDCQIP